MKQDLKGPESGLKMHFQVMSCKVNVYGISVIPCYACMVCDAVAQNCFKVLWSVRLILKYHMIIKRTRQQNIYFMEIYRWKVSAMLDCWGANSN